MKKQKLKKLISYGLVLCIMLFGTLPFYAMDYGLVANPNVTLPYVEPLRMTQGSFVIEAEDMTHTKSFVPIEDEDASGGIALEASVPEWRFNPIPDQGADLYTEFLPDADYRAYMWIRFKADTADNGSFHHAFNTESYTTKHAGQTDGYTWLMLKSTTIQSELSVALNIQYRCNGWIVDKIIVTDDPSFEPKGKDDLPGDESSKADYTGLFPEPPIKPVDGHPRLFFTKNDIPEILSRLEHKDMADVYNKYVSYADNEVTGLLDTSKINNYDRTVLRNIVTRAFFYALGLRDAEHAKKAIEAMKNYYKTVEYNPNTGDITREMGYTMMASAVVYDWCYDIMTAEDKALFIKNMKVTAKRKEIGYPPTGQIDISGHSGEGELFGHLLSCGIAVFDEDKEIYELSAGRMFAKFLDIRVMWNKTGNHPIGTDYGAARYVWELAANQLFIGMGYKDGILGSLDDVTRVSKKFLYTRLPLGSTIKWGDSYQWSSNNKVSDYWFTEDSAVYYLTAGQADDPHINQAAAVGDYFSGGSTWIHTIIPSVILMNPESEKEFMDSLPLANKTDYPLTSIQARTNWTMGDRSNTAAVYLEGREKMIKDHQHADIGSFQLYYKGYLALNGGTYSGSGGGWGGEHWYNYYSRTVSHNAMTVYDPSEEFYVDYHNKTGDKLANDGGQINTQEVKTYEQFLANKDEAKTDAWYIGPNKQTPEFSFLKTNLTNAYGNGKVKNHERSMVFMDLDNDDYPAALVVFDDIESSKASFKKSWLMNTELEPQINGDTVTVIRNDNGNNGKLVNKTFLPENPSILNIGGEGKDSWVDGKNYASTLDSAIRAEQGNWRIEISPSAEANRDYFLNSMYVTDYDRNLSKLDMYMEEGDDVLGVTIRDRAVYFPKEDSLTSDFSLQLRDNGYDEVKCLVTDIKPGIWKLTSADGLQKLYKVKEGENSLYFRCTVGSYTLSKQNEGEADLIEYPQMQKPQYGDFMVYDKDTKMFLSFKKPLYIQDNANLVPLDEFVSLTSISVNAEALSKTIIDGTEYVNIEDIVQISGTYDRYSRVYSIRRIAI